MVGIARYAKKPAPPYRFRPPRHVPFLMWLGSLITPLYIWMSLKVKRIEIGDNGLEVLQSLRDHRVVLTPNHPTRDPPVIFLLSRKLKLNFCWMAARELTDRPLTGFLTRRLGVYSIDRGRRDDAAKNTTQQLLCEGKHWVVLFPEGVNHFLHDEVMPFLPGAARMGLGAMDSLKQATGGMDPVYIVPVALRYYYLKDMRRVAMDSLARLERRLGLPNQGKLKWQDRMAAISNLVLELNERLYGVLPPEHTNENARLNRLKEIAIGRIAEGLGILPLSPDEPLRNRIRKLLNLSNQMLEPPSQLGGTYAQDLSASRREQILQLRKDLSRIATFMPVRWDYEIETPTVENFLDILNILEMDLLGKARTWGPRGIMIKVGKPVDLRQYYAEYQAAPRETSEKIMHKVEDEVRELLKSTKNLMTPLPQTMLLS